MKTHGLQIRVSMDCFVPRNDGDTYRHCEEQSNPENYMNNAGQLNRLLRWGLSSVLIWMARSISSGYKGRR